MRLNAQPVTTEPEGTMADSIQRLMQSISEIKRLARLMGASRVNLLHARQDSIFYFVNPDGDGPDYPLDADEMHYEFPGEAVLLVAIFPVKEAGRHVRRA
jgi:hypothetical protein